MINLKKSYYCSILAIYLFSLLSFVMAENSVYLWDLGVKIESQPQEIVKSKTIKVSENKKYATLTKRHVKPQLVNVELIRNNMNSTTHSIQEFSTLNYLEQYNLGNKYFTSGRYVEAIKLLERVDFSQLSSNQKIHLMKLHADALLNLGHYSRIVNILTANKKAYDLNDELLFLLGMSSTKLGNKKIALHAFNTIIENHPNSEYQNIAKLQVRVLKR